MPHFAVTFLIIKLWKKGQSRIQCDNIIKDIFHKSALILVVFSPWNENCVGN